MRPGQVRTPIKRLLDRAMKHYDVPGVAIGILHDGQEFHFGFGVTNIEFPLPVDEDTLFMIGSTTKTFTATAIMRLVEQGKVDLSAPVKTYLPELRLADASAAAEVTVLHLLSHTGGWLGDYFDDTGRGADALRRIVRRMAKKAPQQWPLGKYWSYNNAGFYVAGRLIEKVTRKPFERVIKESIFDPLGMDHSFFFAEDVMARQHALGHIRSGDGLKIARPWGLSRSSNAAGGIASNVIDQLKYARFHLGDGTASDGARLLKRASLARMQRPVAKAGRGLADAVGVTWLLEDIAGVRIVKHGGAVNGQKSAFFMVPSRGFAMTILTNGDRGNELYGELTDWALDHLLGIRRQVPPTRQLSRARLSAYAGRYDMRESELVLTPSDGTLIAKVVLGRKLRKKEDAVAALPPPFRVALINRDRALVLDEPFRNIEADFIRDGQGEVAWIGFGGRMYPRRAQL